MSKDRMFPVQKSRRYGKPHPTSIPWSVAELAYSQYHHDQSLERLAERGGFGPGEMDMYCPDWIERCDRITKLEATNAELEAQLTEALAKIEKVRALNDGRFLRGTPHWLEIREILGDEER